MTSVSQNDINYLEKLNESIIMMGLQNVPQNSVTDPKVVGNIIFNSLSNYNYNQNEQNTIKQLSQDQIVDLTLNPIPKPLVELIKYTWSTEQINSGTTQFISQVIAVITDLMEKIQRPTPSPTPRPTPRPTHKHIHKHKTMQTRTQYTTIIFLIVFVLLLCIIGIYMYNKN